MSIIEKLALTINAFAVAYFAFVAGMRYERRKAAGAQEKS